jgi:hypothetical protein
MPQIVVDRSGELRKGTFYQFNVPFEDEPVVESPTAEWIVVPRTPRGDELTLSGKETYTWIEMTSGWEHRVETKDCPADKEHVTHQYFKKMRGEKMGGKRLSPFIPSDSNQIVLSEALYDQIAPLKLRGARIDLLDLRDHHTDAKITGFWSLQFVGKTKLRLPKFVDVPNRCPHCHKSKIICESCGHWSAYCSACEKQMVIIETKHLGKTDPRLAFEDGLDPILGKTWDGSDLVQARGRNFASKRFIDWLLRIHAAPFYAEPVWFCVDGMSDQQKKWLDDLQKPFDV